MAVMNRNPMPLSGALFVTNPRRRRNKMSLSRRKNALRLNRRRNALKLNRRRNRLGTGNANDMTVKELKAELSAAGKSTRGKKAALVTRYKKMYALAPIGASKPKKKGKARKKTGLPAKTMEQLRAMAKSKGLKRYSGLNKKQLISRIRSGKSPAAKARQKSGWAKFQKEMKDLGLNQKEMKYLWKRKKDGKPASDFSKMKKAIGAESRRLASKRIGRSTRRKAMNNVAAKQIALFQNPFKKINPRRRKNAGIMGLQPLAMPLALVQDVQQGAAKIPVVRLASFAITPVALGAAVYGVHRLAEPHIMKFLDDTVADVPVLKETLKFPYTTTGVVAGIALGLLAKANLINPQAASLVAASAASVGIALDLSLRPVAEAAAEVVKEQVTEKGAAIAVEAATLVESGAPLNTVAATAAGADPAAMGAIRMGGMHYGDGGQYMLGANTTSLSGMHYGAVHMGDALQSEYSDASPADAKACTCVMHPEEVAAVKAGKAMFQRKFGMSPRNLKKSQSLMSRHAGRMGHRYGWIIKSIGFANFQKIAALPPKQRATVISQLQQQAIASIPKLIAQQQQANSQVETASVPLAGTLNGVQGFDGVQGYGAMMFAGQGY